MNNEDVCKSLVTQNIITQDSHQTPKMHMITKKTTWMNTKTNGQTSITKHANTHDAKQDGPRAQDKTRMGLRPNTKQEEA